MRNLTAAQLTALTALRTARRNAGGGFKGQEFFTAEEIGGVSGAALSALIRKGLVKRDTHHLSDYVYGSAPRYGMTGLGITRLNRIEREG